MKKILSLTLALVLIIGTLCVFPASAAGKVHKSGDWEYWITDGQAKIYRYVGKKNILTVPDELDGYDVTKIANIQFQKKLNVKKLNISAKITKIAPVAISSMTTLTNVTVKSGNKNYTAKNGILYNKAVTKVIACPGGHTAETLELPSTVRIIGSHAFAYNTNLKTINVPNTVTQIGGAAFAQCSMKKVTIPSSVKTIGDLAFRENNSLTKISFASGAAPVMGHGVFEYCNSLKSVSLPAITLTEKQRGAGMFADCKSITKVMIPSGVKYVPQKCFYNCTSLKSVKVPASVTRISAKAFGVNLGFKVDKRNPNFVIKGKKGTEAQAYAKRLGCKFKAI